MTSHDPVSIAACLQGAIQELQDVGEDARRDAEILLCDILKRDRAYCFAYSEKNITAIEHAAFQAAVARRKSGEPVAYILGKREFWSLPLTVNNTTLIPRPETERLVETALDCCANRSHAHVIDLGTGTGAIALALATEKPDWRIDAVDACEGAVALATKNASDLQLGNVHVYRSHWFSGVRSLTTAPDACFDMVVSNPPYIATDDHHLDCGDVRFEPHSALVAADEGYADLFIIASEAREFLCANGWLVMEHGFAQAQRLQQYLSSQGYVDIKTVRDYAGHERVTLARWPGKATGHEEVDHE